MSISESELRAYAETGGKWATLAERKGVHRQTVYRRARELGLRPVQNTDQQVLRALAAEQMTRMALDVRLGRYGNCAVRSSVGRLRLAGLIESAGPARVNRSAVGGQPVKYRLTKSGQMAITQGTK